MKSAREQLEFMDSLYSDDEQKEIDEGADQQEEPVEEVKPAVNSDEEEIADPHQPDIPVTEFTAAEEPAVESPELTDAEEPEVSQVAESSVPSDDQEGNPSPDSPPEAPESEVPEIVEPVDPETGETPEPESPIEPIETTPELSVPSTEEPAAPEVTAEDPPEPNVPDDEPVAPTEPARESEASEPVGLQEETTLPAIRESDIQPNDDAITSHEDRVQRQMDERNKSMESLAAELTKGVEPLFDDLRAFQESTLHDTLNDQIMRTMYLGRLT